MRFPGLAILPAVIEHLLPVAPVVRAGSSDSGDGATPQDKNRLLLNLTENNAEKDALLRIVVLILAIPTLFLVLGVCKQLGRRHACRRTHKNPHDPLCRGAL